MDCIQIQESGQKARPQLALIPWVELPECPQLVPMKVLGYGCFM